MGWAGQCCWVGIAMGVFGERKKGREGRGLALLFYLFLEGLDAGVAGQIVQPLAGEEDVGLQMVHYVREALREVGAPAFLC